MELAALIVAMVANLVKIEHDYLDIVRGKPKQEIQQIKSEEKPMKKENIRKIDKLEIVNVC